MAREKEYLKAIEANKVIAVGDIGAKSVKVTGLKDGTKYSDITVAYDKDNTTALSDGASEPTAVPEFTTVKAVVNVTGVSLDKTEASVEEGATTQLTATVSPAGASDKSVTWKSGNEATATVDQTGKVTGVKAGTCNVVVTTKDGSKTAQCAITVTAKPAEG